MTQPVGIREVPPVAGGAASRPATLEREIVSSWFGQRGGELVIGGIPISRLAADYGTPFYVYDAGVVRRKVRALKEALPWFDCYYSVKANPNPSIVSLLLAEDCGMEVASVGELDLALACGCDPKRILFAGPGKTDAELQRAVQAGIGEIHVESVGEMARLESLAAGMGVTAEIALRVNPSEAVRGGAQQMGGKPTAFGIDEERLEEAVAALARYPHLRLTGLHVYAGTQILDAGVLAAIHTHIAGLAGRVVELTGRPLRMIDFGGGLGVPYFAGESALDLGALHEAVAPMVTGLRQNPALQQTRLIVEPGRFLTAECGVYVARVVDVKESRGVRFLVLDGGMNHHLAASGQFGQVIKRNFPMVVANRLDEADSGPYEVAGPLCTPLDTVGRGVRLPSAAVGDWVAILQSGAYARTSSPHGFLSHPLPMELLVDDGRASVARFRGGFADLVRGTALDTSAAR